MNHLFTNKKIGIWGLGVSGKALVNYLKQHSSHIRVLEKAITHENLQFCTSRGTELYQDEPSQREQFLQEQDIIIPSPGIDLRPYNAYRHKFLAEVDLFHLLWGKKIIGVTGTLGKTSITHLLTTLLQKAGVQLITGGNIGTGMLDLLASDATTALLELSSFQLEQCQQFAPDGAIITNLYPNHLDRHGTMEAYLAAKKEILIRQQPGQWALVPLTLAAELRKDERLRNRPLAFFTQQNVVNKDHLLPADKVYTPDFLPELPSISYPENWLIIAAALDCMGLDAKKIIAQAHELTLPDYRLEKVATINGVDYYNDSKSTIMQATLTAVQQFQGKEIILLLGGMSKGVDRAPQVQMLKGLVDTILCFGKEADYLHQACKIAGIASQALATLEAAVQQAHDQAKTGMVVVLSPGGTGFDLFKDYKARGARFNELVLQLKQST